MLKLNDFFCGAGGMGLGFKNAGFEITGAWDFDKYAVESYYKNVSERVKLSNISEMKYSDISQSDVWTFGFPCQDISVAGKQKGMIKGETRSGLFYEIMRLLEETKSYNSDNLPRLILAENVKSVDKYMEEIEKEYEKIGYKLYYQLYNSSHWEVPQQRERYFIIGVRKDLSKDFIFPEQEFRTKLKLKDILENEVDIKYNLTKEKEEIAVRKYIENNNKESKNGIIKIGNVNPSGNGMNGCLYSVDGISPCLTTNKGEGIKVLIDNNSDYIVRRLTPRECARLQGFPDTYEFHVSNAQLYKQFGNAVTVNIVQAIANTVANFLLEERLIAVEDK